MDSNIRELSDHVREKRERKGRDSALEDLLEYWGAWRANVISGLSASSRSPITVAIEQYTPCKTSDLIQPKQTRTIQPKVPKYWPHHRMAQINQAVWELQARHQEMLIHYYEDCWTAQIFIKEFNWTKETYYSRISEARKAIKNHPVIKILLHRS